MGPCNPGMLQPAGITNAAVNFWLTAAFVIPFIGRLLVPAHTARSSGRPAVTSGSGTEKAANAVRDTGWLWK